MKRGRLIMCHFNIIYNTFDVDSVNISHEICELAFAIFKLKMGNYGEILFQNSQMYILFGTMMQFINPRLCAKFQPNTISDQELPI